MKKRVIAEQEQEEEISEDAAIRSSDLMKLPGVGAATAEKLSASGFDTMLSIAVATPGELVEASGLTELAARKVIQTAREKMEMGFESADEVLKKRDNITKIRTKSTALNNLLGGGFESGAITECFGAYGSGKCVAKDTKVLYFNSSKSHLQPIEDVYNKYAAINGEKPFEDGFVVEVPQVEVFGLTDNGLSRTKAVRIYKEKVKKLVHLKTKRGRNIKITSAHKLLTFDKNLVWKPSALLKAGEVIAYPKEMAASSVCNTTKDDAYFLGMFVAEGTANPLSIATSSEQTKDWIANYIKNKFSYSPTIRKDVRRQTPLYCILLRKETAEFLGKLSVTNSGSKFVPESLFGADEEVTAEFLSGYMDGDGHFAIFSAEATTKSRELASGLSYMFAKLGIATTLKEKEVKGRRYYRLNIVGDDRTKLAKVISKTKTFQYKPVNSSYGYQNQFTDYLKKTYRETLGGNRGRTRKVLGRKNNSKDIFYDYLIRTKAPADVMNEKTMDRLRLALFNGLKDLSNTRAAISNIENLQKEDFAMAINSLPFAFNSIAAKVGLSKSGIQNYMNRGVADTKKKLLRDVLLKEIDCRINKLEGALKTIKNIIYLNWDTIERAEEIDYNDYVYDFVVPEGHSFVGGEMPTIMHNTQIAHTLCVNVQNEIPESVAVFIDTESTFRPERVKQLAHGLDEDKILKNIKVARAFNSDHQMLLAEKVEDLIKKGLNVKLVVVDSLTAHFRAEFVGRGTLADRQQKLNKHMHTLMRLATTYNICVYVTNQVMSKPDVFFGDPTEAIGGHIVSHNSTYRVYLRRGKKGSRVAKLVDSPNLPEAEAMFYVETEGIRDV